MSQIDDFLSGKPAAQVQGESQIDAFLSGAPKRSLPRSVGDSAIALGTGVVQGVKMLSDVAGADNAVSRGLGKAADVLSDLESPYRKAQKQERAAKIKAAEASGSTWEEVKAHAGAFADAPIDTTLNALGTSVPTLATAAIPGLGQAALATRAAQVGVGVAQGVGNIKGQIHETVKQKLMGEGVSESEASQRADAAQAYGGGNMGSIALGGALGGLAGGTGAESAARRLLGRQLAGEVAERAAPGLVRSAVGGVLKEAPMEAVQGGQERLAGNLALQGEGFDVPTWQGVAGQAALEGLASAPMGGGFGVADGMHARAEAQVRQQAEAQAQQAQDEQRAVETQAAQTSAMVRADTLAQEESTPPEVPQTTPPDGRVILDARRAESRAQVSPDDEIYQSTGADAVGAAPVSAEPIRQEMDQAEPDQRTPSQRMGIDPAAGPLSKVAAMAVDSGASEQQQQAQALQAAAETAKKAPAQATQSPPNQTQSTASEQAVQKAEEQPQQAPAAPLSVATNPQSTTGAPNVGQADQAQQTAAQPAQAGTAPRAPSQRPALQNGAGPAGEISQGTAGVAERPEGWRTSMLKAGPAAKAMGIDPRGKRLAQVVAEIDAADARSAGVRQDGADLAAGKIDRQWSAFAPETGTLGVPRADMPQIKAEHRGALVNFLKARGIDSRPGEVPANDLKPTQAEFSPAKVEKARAFQGGDRSILVSADGYVVDGHHQWLAKRANGEPVKVIRLQAPIRQVLAQTAEFPSTTSARGAQTTQGAADAATPRDLRLADERAPGAAALAQDRAGRPDAGATPAVGAEQRAGSNTAQPAPAVRAAVPDAVGTGQPAAGVANQGATETAPANGQAPSSTPTTRQRSAGDSARSRAYDANPMRAFLGKHGISLDSRSEFAPGLREMRGAMVPGYGPIFRKSGKPLDTLAQAAVEEGFLAEADESQLYNLIDAAVRRGQRIDPQYSGDYADRQWRSEMERRDQLERERAEEEQAAVEAELSEHEALMAREIASISDFDFDALDARIPLDSAPSNISTEQAMRLLGFTEEEIHAVTQEESEQAGSGLGQAADGLAAGEASAGDGRSQGPARSAQAPSNLELTAPTREEILARKAEEERARAESEQRLQQEDQRARADADRDSFSLTGSDRPADVLAAQGQQDIFSGQGPTSAQATAAALPQQQHQDKPKQSSGKAASTPARIDDFGETLHGARKMLYAEAYADGMAKAKELDTKAHPLSKTWPEPDYLKLLDGGARLEAVSIARALRDAVPTKPQSSWKLKGWATQVETLRGFAEDALSGQQETSAVRIKLNRDGMPRGIADKAALYEAMGHERSLKGIEVSVGRYSMYDRVEYNPPRTIWSVSREAKGSSFGNWPRELAMGDTREAAIAAFKKRAAELLAEEQAPTKGATFEIYSKRAGGAREFFIGKKIGRNVAELKAGFTDLKAARQYKADHQVELEELLAKHKAVPPVRNTQNAPRIGEDYRQGADVSPAQFQEAFGFRGVQFGNYVEGARRQQDLNRAYDALMDLAGVLNLPPRALSLGGRLGLAFGARGTGGTDAAAAHYERGNVVINLTKREGAGSLAHEWWHGLDNYFSRQRGDGDSYMTADSRSGDGVREEMRAAFRAVMSAINLTGMQERSRKLDDRRTKEYWTTKPEMSARAFESYVISKLQDQNAGNDYLANVVGDAVFALEGAYPYPTAGELPQIREALDAFFQTVQTRQGDNGETVLFSRSPATQSTYEARIDALFAGEKPRLQGARVLDRSDMLAFLGLGDGPVNLAEGKVTAGQDNHPHMTAAVWKKIPEWLENPALVFDSDTSAGRLVFIAPELVNGSPVRIILEPNAGGGAKAHLLMNAYDARGGSFRRWEQDGLLRYVDRNKYAHVSGTFQPRLVGLPGDRGRGQILTDKQFTGWRRANNPAYSQSMSPELARKLLAIPRPATKESVRAAVRELVNGLGMLPNRLGRVVVATAAEIQQDWEPLIGLVQLHSEQGGSDGGAAQGFYDPKSKTVFLIADHIRQGDELGVVAHELMHKHGQAVLGEEGWNRLHGAIEGWATAPEGSQERSVYDEAAARVRNSRPDDAVEREYSSQELFPYAVQVALEQGVRPNLLAKQGTVARWLGQVKAALRDVWAKITAKPEAFNSQDLVNLAYGIAQRENPEHAGKLDGAMTQSQTETSEFKRWFGDSKVADSEGSPLVVYHSTSSRDNFTVFKTDRELGAHFGTIDQAHERGGYTVIPAYLSIKNPLRLEDRGDFHAGNVLLQLRRLGMISRQQAAGMSSDVREIQRVIEAAGYDGVVYLNRREIPGVFGPDGMDGDALDEMSDADVIEQFGDDAADSWIAFRPEQIKSAIGNRGTFDSANQDVRFSHSAGNDAPEESVGSTLLELGRDERLYQYPRSYSTDIVQIGVAKDLVVGQVDRNARESDEWMLANTTPEDGNGVQSWMVRLPNGRPATITNDNGQVYINVSAVGEGGGGSRVYDLAANYALNNGAVFVGDPNGVSASAIRRRLENMLSSAVKYGTTGHLAPHPDQVAGRDGVAPLEWTPGDTLGNIESMVKASVAATEATNPLATSYVRYETQTRSFDIDPDYGGRSGQVAQDLSDLLDFDGRTVGLGQGGRRTVQRAVFLRALLSGVGERRRVLESFRAEQALGSQGTAAPEGTTDRRIFYSRSVAAAPATGDYTPDQARAAERAFGFQQKQTWAERAQAFRAKLGTKLRQGLVDQFAPIKEVSDKAYMLARMSKGSDGAVEAALLYGKPFLRDGVYDVDIKDGGFAQVLASLKGEHDRFFQWVAAQRAERLKAEGKENLLTDQDITALRSLNVGKMADGAARMPVYAAALRELNAFNEATLKVAMESGLIDQAAFDLMKDQPYVPFYRLMEEEGGMRGPRFSSGLVNQQAWKKLKGGTQQINADLLQNTLMNWSHLYAAAARNRASLETMAAAEKMGIAYQASADTKGTVKVMRDGVAEHWAVEDPYLLDAISAMNYAPGGIVKAMAPFKRLLTFGVTVNPTFKIRNLIRDSLSAIAQSELSYNPLENVSKGWKATGKASQTYASMLASGGIIKFGTQEDTNRVRAQIEKLGGQVLDHDGWGKLKGQMRSLWEAYEEFGDRTENVNRAALYERLVSKGHSHADASFMARDLMDFSMSGKWEVVRFLTQTVPFLNARMQGLYKLGRAAKEDPRRFAAMAGAVSLASLGLLAAYSDDDDWKKREDWDRDNFWWFKIGDMAFRVPKPFEVGAIGTLAERTAELMMSDEMTGKRFGQRISDMVFNTFAMDPTPQFIKPFIDVYANKDSFSGRPIEGLADERLRPQDRYNERTSEAARLLGSWGLPDPVRLAKGEYAGLSPKQIDFLLRGYFGWLATVATTVTDAAARPAMDRGERPAMRLRDTFLAGNFVESLPTGSSRYVTTMYEQARDVEQAWASYQAALKSGDVEKARDIQQDEAPKLRNRMAVESAKRLIAELGQQAKRIESNRLMPAEEKRRRLDEIEARKHEAARRVAPTS